MFEAEGMVSSLKAHTVADVGSEAWMLQYEYLEKLNVQAHSDAITKHDEIVVEAFLNQSGRGGGPGVNKLDCLVHELVVTELWIEHVFPILQKQNIFNDNNATKGYLVVCLTGY